MKNRGITLIALVVTVIVLIILAGVAINLSIGENGIFNKAQEAREKYTIEKIREEVEIGIMNLEIKEVVLGNEVTIELILQELLEEGIFESIDKDTQIGDIGEYEIKLKYNEERKVVIEYIKKATGIRLRYNLDPIGYTNGDKVKILLTVRGRAKSITKPDGLIEYPESETVIINYEVIENGTYKFIIEDEEGNKEEKNVIVDTIDRLAPNDFEITVEDLFLKIKIKANTTDAEADGTSVKSGIEKYEYFVKKESEIEYTKYDTNIIEVSNYGTYEVYVTAYDKAGNYKDSAVTTITVEKPSNSKRYVDYGIDLNDDGDTTNDWMIFYEEENEASDYYGATYIIPAYYVPYEKMTTSISNAKMKLYSGTYRVYWSSAPSYKTITSEVKSIFMYKYSGGSSYESVKCISRLLDASAWKDDFVTVELQEKGGMAIGAPTLDMWAASWNKEYPTTLVTPVKSGTGYQFASAYSRNLSSSVGYKTDAPNVYFPANSKDSDGTLKYWLATPSSFEDYYLMTIRYDGYIYSYTRASTTSGVRPLVYLPSSVKVLESEIPNLYNIDYGE